MFLHSILPSAAVWQLQAEVHFFPFNLHLHFSLLSHFRAELGLQAQPDEVPSGSRMSFPCNSSLSDITCKVCLRDCSRKSLPNHKTGSFVCATARAVITCRPHTYAGPRFGLAGSPFCTLRWGASTRQGWARSRSPQLYVYSSRGRTVGKPRFARCMRWPKRYRRIRCGAWRHG